jgi:hypothetical protein
MADVPVRPEAPAPSMAADPVGATDPLPPKPDGRDWVGTLSGSEPVLVVVDAV